MPATESPSDADDEEGPVELLVSKPKQRPAMIVEKTGAGRWRRRRNPEQPRAKTIAVKSLTRAEIARGAMLNPPVEGVQRPSTRAECVDGPRPCPWVGCKHNLYLDVNPETGSLKLNFPDLEPWELAETCALDVAERGAITLEEVGLVTNVTRERIRQIETRGLLTMKQIAPEHGLAREDAYMPHPEGNEHPDATRRPRDEELARRDRSAKKNPPPTEES